MAITQNTYTGNGSTVLYSFTFPYLSTADIRVSINNVETTSYTLANATTVQFTTAPANGAVIRIYRATADNTVPSRFYPGSSIRSQDLNNNFDTALYIAQETKNITLEASTGSLPDGSVTSNLIANSSITPLKLDRTYLEPAAAASTYLSTATAASTYAALGTAQTFTKAQRGASVLLADQATITPDFSLGNNYNLVLAGNRTLANPTNLTAGQSGVITVGQDSSGSRILAFGSYWKFPGGTAPTLTTTANATDVLCYYVDSSTRITARLVSDVK